MLSKWKRGRPIHPGCPLYELLTARSIQAVPLNELLTARSIQTVPLYELLTAESLTERRTQLAPFNLPQLGNFLANILVPPIGQLFAVAGILCYPLDIQ